MSPRDELRRLGSTIRGRFDAQKRVLSIHEFLDLFSQHPARHTRDASRYLRDCVDYYGTYEVEKPWGRVLRYRLFDLPFEKEGGRGGRARRDHLVGHEAIQAAVYRIFDNFVREGRANRLILLHGPNGSAKSTFFGCIMRALENYSAQDEGALYRFSWIFPRGRDGKSSIGFAGGEEPRSGDSYAHLPEDRIEVKLPSELREHPLLLVPREERRELILRAYEARGVTEPPPDWLWNGQLGHKNKQIFEALLTAYRGEIDKVLAHVQVERYYISQRYRVGAVTIGPQMAVDAHERQITADHSLNSLPASLSSLTLFEPYGELVDASGGIVEYSDLLKRPLDAWKYLLLAIETGEVSLNLSNVAINAVLVASSNELHLGAFREHHEYNSFRGRIQFVRVPYLLDYRQEQGIYDAQIVPQIRRHTAPHATYVAGLWAVLTRLRRPRADRYESTSVGRIAADLSPMEKAELYADGRIPQRIGAEDAKELKGAIRDIMFESDTLGEYEGLTGASPREVRNLLLEAAHDPGYACLSPLSVLECIDSFCQRGDYDFLKQTADRGFHDHRGFVRQVREKWLDRVDGEVRTSSGLIEETQYVELFDRYVTHVSHWIKSERVYNRLTGKYEEPDTDLMEQVERMLDATAHAQEFRHNLISAVAGHAIDHPGQPIDYERLFPRFIEKMKEAYYGERKKQLATLMVDVVRVLDGESPPDEERKAQAKRTLDILYERHGYEATSARDAVSELLRARYTT